MTVKPKSIVERLIDGFPDYFTNKADSFDARYVGGQLFLYGKANAMDIGLASTFGGNDQTKINCMLQWFLTLWKKDVKIIREHQQVMRSFDPFNDSCMQFFPLIKRPVTTEEYVVTLIDLTEKEVYLNLNHETYLTYRQRIIEICHKPEVKLLGVEYSDWIDFFSHFKEEVKICIERLKQDYDGKGVYPTATLTYFSVHDQVMNMLRFIMSPTCYEIITFQQESLLTYTDAKLKKMFKLVTVDDILQHDLAELLVLTLKSLELITQTILLLFKMSDNYHQVLNQLLKDNHETV